MKINKAIFVAKDYEIMMQFCVLSNLELPSLQPLQGAHGVVVWRVALAYDAVSERREEIEAVDDARHDTTVSEVINRGRVLS